MNQQRSRRFRSARDAIEAREAALRRGEPPPEGDPFDSNCITPGTEFMARLSEHLQFFIRKQQTYDPAWQKMAVILSGHEVPGEGEHKIMEHMRWARQQPGYAPNQRHCMYGLDADLIMLALVTHEPHFCLLREVVSFGGSNSGQPSREVLENPSEESFQLLQICLLRDYFDAEFKPVPEGTPAGEIAKLKPDAVLPFGYDLERVIDDLVFMAMLVGNDFLPPLPTLDIAEGALNSLFTIYKEELPLMGGYLTHAGTFEAARLERILSRVAALEADVLMERAKNAEEVAEKKNRQKERDARKGGGQGGQGGRGRRRGVTELDEADQFEAELADAQAAILPVSKDGSADVLPEEAVVVDPSMMRPEKRAFFLSEGGGGLAKWKAVYYAEKLELEAAPGSDDVAQAARGLVFSYLEGLAWVQHYYYRGVASWGWYFPHHYAPMASDLCGPVLLDAAAAVSFQLGTPFAPFEQLLAVLPAASAGLLPPAFRHLMLDAGSPVKDFYPLDFKIDFEGKRNDWEGIVQVPFIDEARLLAAAASVQQTALTPAERARNAPGCEYRFIHQAAFAEDYPSSLPRSFAGLFPSRCAVAPQAPRPALPPDTPGFGPWLVKGTRTGAKSPPGFPTLHTVPTTAKLVMAGVTVFGTPSRKESLILRVPDLGASAPSAEAAAALMLGRRCFVTWPFLQEALVVGVSDATTKLVVGSPPKRWAGIEVDAWKAEASKMSSKYFSTQGLDLGKITLLVHVTVCQGLVRHADGSLQKRFGGAELAFPLQVTLHKAPGGTDPRLVERGAQDAAPLEAATTAVFLGRSHFGSVAQVVDGPGGDGTYTVAIRPTAPDSGAAQRVFASHPAVFMRSGAMARKLRLSPRLLGQLTGQLFVKLDDAGTKVDVGLNLKSAKHGLCVPDYCRPAPDDEGWEYTDAAAQLVTAYSQRAPWLFKALADAPEGGPPGLDVRDALPGMTPAEAARQAYDVAAWLKKQPVGRRPLVKTTAVVPPDETIRALVAATAVPASSLPAIVLERVAPPLLLAPVQEVEVTSVLAGGDFALGDRVVTIAAGGGTVPPFGSRGTVVGIHPWEVGASLEVLLDAAFEQGSDLHGRVPKGRGAFLPSTICLNLTHPPPLPSLGAWAPPQRSRKPPPPLPPADGRVAWLPPSDGAAVAKPMGALAAAKMALAQLTSLAPAPAPAPAVEAKKTSAAPAAKKSAPPSTTAAAQKSAATAATAAALAKLTVNGGDGERAKQQQQQQQQQHSGSGGRGSGGASGRGEPSGFAYSTQQGRGRGRGAPSFAGGASKGGVGEAASEQAPAALTESAQPAASSGQKLLAMLHSGPASSAVSPGQALLAMVQPRGGPAPAPGAALLAMVQGANGGGGSGDAHAVAPAGGNDAATAALWAALQGGAQPVAPQTASAGNAILRMVGGGDQTAAQ